MESASKAALMVLAAAAIVAGLVFFRDPLTQLALAAILFIAISGLAEWLDTHVPFVSRAAAIPVAVVAVLTLVGVLGFVVVENAASFAGDAALYRDRLNELLAQAHSAIGFSGDPPQLAKMWERVSPSGAVGAIANSFQAIASDSLFILIYVAFLFVASTTASKKLDLIFPNSENREAASQVLTSIRGSMIEYLWVTTWLGLVTSALIYVAFISVGLQNALFWSFLIFFLSFIPTLGPLVSPVFPTIFALAQYQELWPAAFVFASVSICQFVINNLVQPRIMAHSLNLSPLIVLFSVAIWGAIWGVAGAFLSAPLTVMFMILTAHFKSTRWIAILLSDDGEPESLRPKRKFFAPRTAKANENQQLPSRK